MILQALVAYYETMAAKGEIARPGWASFKISFALAIDAAGALTAILPLKTPDEKGKKMLPREMALPALSGSKGSGIKPNFLWGNAAYLLGYDPAGNPKRVRQCFDAAKAFHLALLAASDDPFAKAICAFFEKWEPDNAQNVTCIAEIANELAEGSNIVFLLGSQYPPDNASLRVAWQRHYDGTNTREKMMCLVTGESVVPEAIHPTIKNVRGAQSSGAALVSFNTQAACSYGREQNLNAPVGKYAAFAYTTALNKLLADRQHTCVIGDTTVVFWAESAEAQYQDCFGNLLGSDSTVNANDLYTVMKKLANGEETDWDGLPLSPDNKLYVLGLSPNAARVSVRFFLRNSFGNFAKHLKAHHDRLEIVKPSFDTSPGLPLWKLLRETVNPHAQNKNASPQLAGDTIHAILAGGRYPVTLYQALQLRIRADRNINYPRAAAIKAYLLRNAMQEVNKEVLTVQLNSKTTYQPYVLGRLFSMLEAIQEAANSGITTTIKDKYLSAACATPVVVFPVLLSLAEKHLRKLDQKAKIFYAKQLTELTSLLTESYPSHHTLHDQGIFQLGYYHQQQKRFEKKTKTEGETENV